MTIADIEKKIIADAQVSAAKIKAEADKNLQALEKQHTQKKEELKTNILRLARQKAEEVKRSHLVPARLAAKKALLQEKQNILSSIYKEIQKHKKFSHAETIEIREETEIMAALLLFGA